MEQHDNGSSRFPDPRDYGDIVALGGNLTPELLMDAYRHGIFPWPMDGAPRLPWFCPEQRSILVFDQIHVPRSLEKARRHSSLRFTHDQAFADVIHECRVIPRPGQKSTWITPEMEEAYTELHRLGHAHSIEAWNGDKLVAGIYGVDGGGTFSAESMFHLEPNASKLVLLRLVDHLKSRGLGWLDIQVMTPHMEKLGATEIDREDFLNLMKTTQQKRLLLFP